MDAYEDNSMLSNNPGKIPFVWDEIQYSSLIDYVYAFPDENGRFPTDRYQTGLVTYFFDDEEILIFVELQWVVNGE